MEFLRDSFSLILHLVLFRCPSVEGLDGFVAEQGDERDGTIGDVLLQLLVDEVVGEIDVSGVLFRVAVIDAFDMRPIDGTQAHRAGLAGGVDNAIGKVEGAQLAAGLTNGVHLSVGSRVVVDGHAVGAARDDFSVLHDDGPKGTATVFHALVGEADGLTHIFLIFFCDVHGCLILKTDSYFL